MSCPACFRGAAHDHAEPKGTMETIHGMRTYVAGGSDPARSKSAIIYLPDAFSLKLVNNKLLADEYAAGTGCKVYIPDVVMNGGLEPSLMSKMETLMTPNPSWTITGVLSKISTALILIPSIVPFLLFAHPSKIYPKILSFARAVKADLPPGGKLGAAGFCWGAWPATKLCVETTSTATPDSDISAGATSSRLIDAQFNGHPSYMVKTPEMVVDAIRKFKVPYSSAVAENDMQFNKAEAEKVEARLREVVGASTGATSGGQGGEGEGEEGCTYEFKIYDGCVHGFCVRAPIGKYDDTNESGYERAKRQAVEWFDKYLN
ncbi:hypothetical protein H2202_002550 [Exophiala xenobiotica]|nr:hypothetical protein H2202_002550 [Exophiala xenobiotica]KAK5205108.1 hypothetical protein LTR41_009319 [Exophiala xenobiotica]KAK5230861.1 hypothetical protein LTR72_000040 [Exophiala xenobiotica]KAK5293051.1 hypothetical protein LTR14_005401 [Exophiala xenobiotica]KAK5322680.1 hypothetical protein LTR93_005884 [Exophiala xenobiotica]